MTELADANRRLVQGAAERGLEVTVQRFPEGTRTAQDAADACGCGVEQIVKSLIFRGADSGKPYLFLVSGANRVDEKGAARQLGEKLERPDAAFVREVTGYAIGGVPPLAHKSDLATYIDRDLLAYESVWAAAGTPDSVFPVEPHALMQAAKAQVLDV